ncbi:hypothetical protein [Methylobacterium segetis]|uniref:hypothetical protein n=1 Tax=Methylobacterium segetis TaxID=2488750 RepID=UPI001046CBCA|nr:hypothetical protein [Methylobacterium segetis]
MTIPLRTGQAIRFGAGEAGLRAIGTGWSAPEPGQVWSDGPEAWLHLGLGHVPSGSRLVIHASPYLGDGSDHQPVLLFGNGAFLHSGRLERDGTLACSIPTYLTPGLIAFGQLDLAFALPGCRIDRGGADSRRLGLALHALQLQAA